MKTTSLWSGRCPRCLQHKRRASTKGGMGSWSHIIGTGELCNSVVSWSKKPSLSTLFLSPNFIPYPLPHLSQHHGAAQRGARLTWYPYIPAPARVLFACKCLCCCDPWRGYFPSLRKLNSESSHFYSPCCICRQLLSNLWREWKPCAFSSSGCFTWHQACPFRKVTCTSFKNSKFTGQLGQHFQWSTRGCSWGWNAAE